MRIFELVIIGIILSGCTGCICWVLRDMYRQLKAYEENCIGVEEDDEE